MLLVIDKVGLEDAESHKFLFRSVTMVAVIDLVTVVIFFGKDIWKKFYWAKNKYDRSNLNQRQGQSQSQ